MNSMRMVFFSSAGVILAGITLTGFDRAHGLLYLPVAFFLFAALTGLCPGERLWRRLGFFDGATACPRQGGGMLLLWVNAALFAVFGIGFTLAPALFAGLVTGSAPATAAGVTDMRATYGGVAFGIGLLLAWHAQRPERWQGGLRLLLAIALPLAGARLYGMVVAAAFDPMMVAFLGAELTMAALAGWLLQRKGET